VSLYAEGVEAYERLFAPITVALGAGAEPDTIDVSDVTLMNSSGIRAIASMVLTAKRAAIKIVLVGRARIPWQQRASRRCGRSATGSRCAWSRVKSVLLEAARAAAYGEVSLPWAIAKR